MRYLSLFQSLKLTDRKAQTITRQALAQYADKPTTYNHRLSTLRTMLKQAKIDGHIEVNWAQQMDELIKPEQTQDQRAAKYIPLEYYLKIRAALVDNFTHHGRKRNGEWLGRVCDLTYFMSCRPADAVELRDDAFDESGVLTYTTNKTDELVAIEDESGSLRETVMWFREWKKYNHTIHPRLILYPAFYEKRQAGRPVPVGFISRRFSKAVDDAGYKNKGWTLRMLRHTGITDELRHQGEGANKGAHRSALGQKPYRADKPVTKVKNTLKLVPDSSD